MTEEDIAAKDLCDFIDSDILLKIISDAGAKLDDSKIPLMGRYFWNPDSQRIEGPFNFIRGPQCSDIP